MPNAAEAGKSLLSSVLAKLPEELRGQAEKIFTAPEATDALTVIGTGALGQAEINRRLNEIKETEGKLKEQEDTLLSDYDNLKNWHEQQKVRLGKVETLEAEIARLQGNPPPVNPPKVDPPASGLSREDIDKILLERDRGYANVLALGVEVGAKHLHTFGEPPDMRGIIELATKKGLSLEAAYQEKYGDKLAERAKQEDQARIDKIVAEKLAEARKQDASQPYPLRSREPSVLDVLSQPDFKPTDFTVDAAVAEYERLQNGSH